MLTKMGVPVFVEPAATVSKAAVANLSLSKGKLAFDVGNAGNVHFVAAKVLVRTLGAGGQVLNTDELQGWYILAGTTRRFELAIPPKFCDKAKSFAVEVPLEKGGASGQLAAPAHACGP